MYREINHLPNNLPQGHLHSPCPPDYQQHSDSREGMYLPTHSHDNNELKSFDKNMSPDGKCFSIKVHGTKAALAVKYDRTRINFFRKSAVKHAS